MHGNNVAESRRRQSDKTQIRDRVGKGWIVRGRHGRGGLSIYPPGSRCSCGQQEKIFLMLRCKAVATRETNESISAKPEAIRESAEVLRWCPGAESNHRHRDFQSPMPLGIFSLCVKRGSLERGRHGGGGLSIYPRGLPS